MSDERAPGRLPSLPSPRPGLQAREHVALDVGIEPAGGAEHLGLGRDRKHVAEIDGLATSALLAGLLAGWRRIGAVGEQAARALSKRGFRYVLAFQDSLEHAACLLSQGVVCRPAQLRQRADAAALSLPISTGSTRPE
jgi:hypothetical protein